MEIQTTPVKLPEKVWLLNKAWTRKWEDHEVQDPSAAKDEIHEILEEIVESLPGGPPAAMFWEIPDNGIIPDWSPGPAVAGIPIGLVPSGWTWIFNSNALRSSGESAPDHRTISILAMWKPRYLAWGERLHASALRGVASTTGSPPWEVSYWPATDVLRDELCQLLAGGSELAIYIGHGREKGWSGYRGVRWRHVEASQLKHPIGGLVSFACRNLAVPSPREPSFGMSWVYSGRARAFLGALSDVRIEPLETIGNELEALLAERIPIDLADLVSALDSRITKLGAKAVRDCWNQFRILGNPIDRIECELKYETSFSFFPGFGYRSELPT